MIPIPATNFLQALTKFNSFEFLFVNLLLLVAAIRFIGWWYRGK